MYSTPDMCWIHQDLGFKDRVISKKRQNQGTFQGTRSIIKYVN